MTVKITKKTTVFCSVFPKSLLARLQRACDTGDEALLQGSATLSANAGKAEREYAKSPDAEINNFFTKLIISRILINVKGHMASDV